MLFRSRYLVGRDGGRSTVRKALGVGFAGDTFETERTPDRRRARRRPALRDLRWSSLYRVNVRMARRYRVDRVLLAGDAAHVHSSASGQGLNSSVQDACNLGWKLAGAVRGATEELLDSYEVERQPVAADVPGLSTMLHLRNSVPATAAHRRSTSSTSATEAAHSPSTTGCRRQGSAPCSPTVTAPAFAGTPAEPRGGDSPCRPCSTGRAGK